MVAVISVFSLILLVVALITLRPRADELVFTGTTLVRDQAGSVKLIGFATNNSRRFLTLAVIEVSFLLQDGQVFRPNNRFVISAFARPGQTFPFHTGWETVPNLKSLHRVKFIYADAVRDPEYWAAQAAQREQIQVPTVAPKKDGGMLGITGDVATSIRDVTSVHAAFAYYDAANALRDVQSWTLRPAKSFSRQVDRFTFDTAWTQSDPAFQPVQIRAYVQHFETAANARPEYLPPEPSVQ